ncbi:MAG: cytochrome c3 family protein [Polyangiaceae bacterium]
MTKSGSAWLLTLAVVGAAALALGAPKKDKDAKATAAAGEEEKAAKPPAPAKAASSKAASSKDSQASRKETKRETATKSSKRKSPHSASITKGLDCSTCHTPASWRLLPGSSSGGGFDHAVTGFPLTGRHRQTACTSCHTGDRKITRECIGCHEDSHRGRLGHACDRCHSSRSFQDVRALEKHRGTRLPLTGMHALVECSECHQRSAQGVWSGAPADCYACHARDYRRTDIHPLHVGAAGQPALPKNCADCHRPTGWTPVFVPANFQFRLSQSALAPSTHELSFPIRVGRHRGLDCGDCHVALAAPRLVRCTGCHAHGAAKLARTHRRVGPVRERCVSCHRGGRIR